MEQGGGKEGEGGAGGEGGGGRGSVSPFGVSGIVSVSSTCRKHLGMPHRFAGVAWAYVVVCACSGASKRPESHRHLREEAGIVTTGPLLQRLDLDAVGPAEERTSLDVHVG